VAWLTILLLLLGGLIGYRVRHPRLLLGALLVDLVLLAIAADQGIHSLIVVFSVLLPLLFAAFLGAVLGQSYTWSRAVWGRWGSRPKKPA
jgi:hypothetical protein